MKEKILSPGDKITLLTGEEFTIPSFSKEFDEAVNKTEENKMTVDNVILFIDEMSEGGCSAGISTELGIFRSRKIVDQETIQKAYEIIENRTIQKVEYKRVLIGRSSSLVCEIELAHNNRHKIDMILKCLDSKDNEKYFKVASLSEEKDVAYEIGYRPNLLMWKTLDEGVALIKNRKIWIATIEESKKIREQSSWC